MRLMPLMGTTPPFWMPEDIWAVLPTVGRSSRMIAIRPFVAGAPLGKRWARGDSNLTLGGTPLAGKNRLRRVLSKPGQKFRHTRLGVGTRVDIELPGVDHPRDHVAHFVDVLRERQAA